MTSQEQGTLLLLDWQAQRRAGIPPADRKLPEDIQYAREIEATREEMREPRF